MSNQKDRFHLETYREHEIWYNADTDKFTVELLIENDWREKSRKSLNDCRKAIDQHIKATAEFKPIKAFFGREGSQEEITILSIRADGGIIYEDGYGKRRTEISDVLNQFNGRKAWNMIYNFNAGYSDWAAQEEEIKKKHENELKEHRAKMPKLEPMDLSFINNFKSQ